MSLIPSWTFLGAAWELRPIRISGFDFFGCSGYGGNQLPQSCCTSPQITALSNSFCFAAFFSKFLLVSLITRRILSMRHGNCAVGGALSEEHHLHGAEGSPRSSPMTKPVCSQPRVPRLPQSLPQTSPLASAACFSHCSARPGPVGRVIM